MKKLILPFLALFCGSVHAFTLNNTAKLVFSQDEVLVNVASGCTNIGSTDEELLNLVGKAVDNFWNTTPTSRLKLRKGSVVNVSAAYHTDTICTASTNCDPNPDLAVSSDILITCNLNATNFPNSSILGITIPNNISGSNILGALIMINDRADTQFDTKSNDAKVAILAHEIGHAFGLGHSPVVDSLMYYATVSQRKALGRDDIDGISYLYPKQQPVSCGTIDLNGGSTKGGGPDWWSGLFLGFSIIGLAELYRGRKKSKQVQL